MKYVFLSAIILSFCILLNLIAGVYFVLVIFYFFLKKEFQKIFILFLTPFVSFFFFSLYSYTYLSSFFSIFTFLLSPPEILTQFFNYSVKTFPISYLQPYLPTGFISRTFPLPVFFQALIFPSKGIFFYYPVLLFSFIGFFLAKKYKLEFLLLFFSIFFAFLFYSIYAVEWWYGWVSYGPPRVLTMLMPFFVMGLANFLDRFDFKFLIPFFIVSLVNNFLLLQYGEDKISMLPWEEYKSKMENFQVLSNPLFEHYLPLTLINGPRSILLENLIIDKKISIDLKHPYNPITPEFIPPGSPIMKKFEVYLFSLPKVGIVVLRLPWLSLFVTMAVIFFIWRREISSLLKIKPKFLMLLLIFLFFVFFIRIRDFVLGNNWCAPQWDLKKEKMMENGRWTGGNATLFLFSKNEIDRTLKFTVESFRKNQTFKIYLNGEIIGDYIVENKKEILKSIHLKKGVNEIFLDTNDFIEPWKIGVNCDIDVSLKIEELKIF
jgi:hypothetical protein